MIWVDRMSISSPTPIWLRFSAIGVGILILLWLSIEDTSEIPAITIAIFVSLLFALRSLLGKQRQQSLTRFTLLSGLAGVGVIPISLFLIAFKSGLHSHGIPEYPFEQIIAVLRRTPFFAMGGLLVGLGSGTWILSRKT